MSEQSQKKGTMAKDTLIYMLAKGIEGVVGVLTLSAMSHIFVSEQMGDYSTLNIAITTAGMVAIQWLVQSVLRYINKYEIENKQENFYTTVFSAWLKVNLIFCVLISFAIFIVTVVFYRNKIVSNFLKIYNQRLLIIGMFWFVAYNTSQLVIAMLAATRKTKVNLFLSAFSVTGKLLIIILLAKLYGSKIEWIFLSYFIFDSITSVVGIVKLKIYKYINLKNNSKEILNILKTYGMPLMGNMITTSVLNKSDVYIIKGYLGSSDAGIYQTNYSIIAAAFTMLSAAIMRGSYPTIVRTWSEGKKEMTEKLISDAVRMFLIVSFPAVAGVTVLSKTIATVLFAEEYIIGHSIMGWVALGMMFLGLTEYCIKPWELNAKTKDIFYRSLTGGIINVILNIIFVPFFGYKTAAVTTFIGFIIYFILARKGTAKYMKWSLKKVVYFRIIISTVIMCIAIILIKCIINISAVSLAVMIVAGMVAYGICLYLSGEVKPEINAIINKIKK